MKARSAGAVRIEYFRPFQAAVKGAREIAFAVVAMTADAMPEDVARCLAAGMNAHMAKPINQAGLLAAVNRALTGELPEARVTAEAEVA